MLGEIFTTGFFISLFAGTIRLAVPILLAALGTIYTQRSGILNLGLEGIMTVGACTGFMGVYFTRSLWLGVLTAVLSGMLFNSLMGFLSITIKTNQVIAGTAMTILGTGIASFGYRTVFGIQSLPPQIEPFQPLHIPGLSEIPVLGNIFFRHNILIYLAFFLVLVTWLILERTVFGLEIKAVGEHPKAADSKGIRVNRTRYFAILIEGAYVGLAGAFMSIGYMNTFMDTMVSGRGFIALAVVIFARWSPMRAMGGALLFGCASALQMRLQALGAGIPNQFLLMLPYVLTILVLIGVSQKAEFPSAYTKPYSRMER